MRPVRIIATVAILALAAISASAQPIVSAKSGIVANAEGKVLIDNAEIQQSATRFPEVKEGSVLRTEDGRVELMLPPGFMLRMGENGAVKMLANRLIDTRVELQTGSAVVEVDQTKGEYSVNIAVKDAVVILSKVGVYRFDTGPARLKVFQGTATVEIGGQSLMVAGGKMISLAGGLAAAEKFDASQTDALDNWSRRQAEAMAIANVSGAKYGGNSYTSAMGSGSWVYNPFYDMYTYMPMMGTMCNPYYGLCYYSPLSAYQNFFLWPQVYGTNPYVGGYHRTFTGSTMPAASSTWSRPASSGSGISLGASGGGGVSHGTGSMGAGSSGMSGHGAGFSGSVGHGK